MRLSFFVPLLALNSISALPAAFGQSLHAKDIVQDRDFDPIFNSEEELKELLAEIPDEDLDTDLTYWGEHNDAEDNENDFSDFDEEESLWGSYPLEEDADIGSDMNDETFLQQYYEPAEENWMDDQAFLDSNADEEGYNELDLEGEDTTISGDEADGQNSFDTYSEPEEATLDDQAATSYEGNNLETRLRQIIDTENNMTPADGDAEPEEVNFQSIFADDQAYPEGPDGSVVEKLQNALEAELFASPVDETDMIDLGDAETETTEATQSRDPAETALFEDQMPDDSIRAALVSRWGFVYPMAFMGIAIAMISVGRIARSYRSGYQRIKTQTNQPARQTLADCYI